MLFKEEEYTIAGKKILLRPARADEAQMLIDYLKTVSGETGFLLCYPDEIHFTIEQETSFINEHNTSDNSALMLAFVDGEYAGNCSFDAIGSGRRYKHRANIGIALFLKYTGFGLGRRMLTSLLEIIKRSGFEQAELAVYSDNDRAKHLYSSLGFKECGRKPNAVRYDDGSYNDEILMVKTFR